MPRARRVCSCRGCSLHEGNCPTTTTGSGRCVECTRASDRARGNFRARGYGGPAWDAARLVVLDRDSICVVCHLAPANTADHYPLGRDELLARGVRDPDAPEHMRGICRRCHSRETAKRQPGGWNNRV